MLPRKPETTYRPKGLVGFLQTCERLAAAVLTGKGRGKGKSKRDKRNERTRKDPTGTSPSRQQNRPPCSEWLKSACLKAELCDFWHSPKCRFFNTNSCTSGDKCKFLHVLSAAASISSTETIHGANEHKQNEAKPKAKTKAKAKVGAAFSLPLLVAAPVMGEASSLIAPLVNNSNNFSGEARASRI